MSFNTRVFNIMIGLSVILALSSCGGDKSKSDAVRFQVNPSKPIVIAADAPRGNNKTIKGPWFAFSLTMTNPTAEKITVIALEYEVTGQGDSGPITNTGVFSPSSENFTEDDLKCEYVTYGTWDPGETRIIGLPHGNPSCARTSGLLFYAENNPEATDRPNFHYRVKIKPAGWFGTFDNATDRFIKTFNFSTQ